MRSVSDICRSYNLVPCGDLLMDFLLLNKDVFNKILYEDWYNIAFNVIESNDPDNERPLQLFEAFLSHKTGKIIEKPDVFAIEDVCDAHSVTLNCGLISDYFLYDRQVFKEAMDRFEYEIMDKINEKPKLLETFKKLAKYKAKLEYI